MFKVLTGRVILIFFKVNFFSRVEPFLGTNVVFRSLFCFGSSSWFIFSVAENGTFRSFLKMGRVFSFSSNFALILVHLPRPAENTSGKLPFNSILIFFSFGRNVFYFLAKRINWLIPEIKFLKPVRLKQIFCVLQYEDLIFWLYHLVILG